MKTLERRLGMWSVVIISLSAMIGSGVFVLPGLAVGMTGGSAWLAYAAVALCVLPTALAKSELASALPRSGGSYVYINQAFGPLTGTVMGLGVWASLMLKSAFALVGFSAYLQVFGQDIPKEELALGLLVLITLLNLGGIKKVSVAQNFVVVLSLGALAALIVIGVPGVQSENFDPFLRKGIIGFGETVAFVFVSYAGITKVAAIAGEVKNPGKNIPMAMMISLAIVTPLYCLVVFVLNGNIPTETLQSDYSPIYSLASTVLGPIGGIVAAVIAILTMTSEANAGLLASSRFPFAMSRDGLVPPFFGVVSSQYLTPVASILSTSAIMASAIIFLDIQGIVKLASAFMILAFAANNLALIILRESKAQWYQPEYKSPLYPGLQIMGLVVCASLLIAMGQMAALALVSIVIPGFFLYMLYGRKRTQERGVLGKMGHRGDLAGAIDKQNYGIEGIISEHAAGIVAVVGTDLVVETLTHMGTALCHRRRVEVIHITEVADSIALDEVLDEDPNVVSMRRRVTSMREMATVDVKFAPMVSHDVVATVHALSSRMHCDWLVMSWKPYRFFNPLGWLYNHLPNDLALFKNSGIRYIRRILVSAQPGPLDEMIVEAAHNLAQYFKATITFGQFVHTGAPESETENADNYLIKLQEMCASPSKALLLHGDTEIEAVSNATKAYDLLIIGARPHNRLSNIFFRTAEDQLAVKSVCSVLLLKSPREGPRPERPEPKHEDFSQYLKPSLVKRGHRVENKEALLKLCAQHFADEVEEASEDEIFEKLLNRERAQNTGVCHGVGMPHATIDTLDRTFLLIEVLEEALDYDAPDNEPVDVIFATIGPPHHRQLHLMLLATLSGKILSTQLLAKLRGAQTPEEAYGALLEVCERHD